MSDTAYAAYNVVDVTTTLCTSGIVAPDGLRQLADAGYRLLINLLPADSPYYLQGEEALAAGLGLDYVHIPVDFAAPRVADFEAFEATMLGAGDRKVWVHCAANYRVSAFVALFARLHMGWSNEQAEGHIEGIWQPSPVWRELLDRILRERLG